MGPAASSETSADGHAAETASASGRPRFTLRELLKQFIALHLQHNGFAVLQRYYERHFTPVGKALLLLLVISLSLGMVGTEVLIYIFLSCLVALWAGTVLIGWLARPRRLRAQVIWPGRLQAGENARCTLILENPTEQPVFHLFSEILMQGPQRQICALRPHGEIFCLDAGERVEHVFEWLPTSRGTWQQREIQFISMFPLGLMRWRQRFRNAQTVWVYPRLLGLADAPWREHQPQMQQLTSQATLLRGQSLEFQGIRPWLPGDSPRFIHWPSLARSGQLAVREYQDSPGHQLALLLQTGASSSEHFEAAVSLMAGLIQSLAAQPFDQLMLAQLGKTLSLSARSPLAPDVLMLQLAQISQDESFELDDLWENLLHAPAGPTLLICLATHWSPALAQLEQQCRLRRWPLEILVVAEPDEVFPIPVRRLDSALWARPV